MKLDINKSNGGRQRLSVTGILKRMKRGKMRFLDG